MITDPRRGRCNSGLRGAGWAFGSKQGGHAVAKDDPKSVRPARQAPPSALRAIADRRAVECAVDANTLPACSRR
jgi:hypothetical protein